VKDVDLFFLSKPSCLIPVRPRSGSLWKRLLYPPSIGRYIKKLSLVKLSETGFVQGRGQFGRKAALRKLKTNNERENETHSDSELCLKYKHRTSAERLSIKGPDGDACYVCLCESGGQAVRARASLEFSGITVLARMNTRSRFEHPYSGRVSKPGKASSNVVLRRQSGKRDRQRSVLTWNENVR
jgi:hypothetical protein